MCKPTDTPSSWARSLWSYHFWICALLLSAPSSGYAQNRAALEQRVERLLEVWQAAERRVFTADSIALSRLQLDTLDYGSIRVVIKTDDAQYVSTGGRLASRILAETLGSDTALIRGTPFRVFVGDSLSGQLFNHTPGGVEMQIRSSYDADMISRLFVEGAGRVLGGLPDAVIRTWLGEDVRVGDADPMLWERSYIEMATLPSRAVNQCFLGDMASCRLAIFPPSDNSATQLYNASERRWAVYRRGRASSRWRGSWRINPVLFDECMDGVDEACLAALRSAPGGFSSPFSSVIRTTLTRTALDIGGAGAYGRLVESRGETVAGRLEYTAGESIDSVISGWRSRVLRAKPASTIAPPALRWWSLLWTIVFVATALRSSRWR